MIKEFAIDPTVIVSTHRDLVYVLEKFGIHHGRLIAEFPSKWKALTYEAAKKRHTGTTELTRITECLNRLKNRKDIFWSKGRSGSDPARLWIEAALQAHQQNPFDFIVSQQAQTDPLVIPFELFDESHPCLVTNRQWSIRRDAESIAGAVEFHITTVMHIKIIDPHFDLGKSRFSRPFFKILEKAKKSKPKIDIYRNDSKGTAELIRTFSPVASQAQKDGIAIRLFVRSSDAMHNRYVLTDRGGVMFGTGLDDDDQGNGTSHDDVTLLDPALRQTKWDEYDENMPVAEWLPK